MVGDELLLSLRGDPVCSQVRVLCDVGVHLFEERGLLEGIFLAIEDIYLFEAVPELAQALHNNRCPKTKVFQYALCDVDGRAKFNLASNGCSGSLLDFGKHTETFLGVTMVGATEVETRRLDTVLEENKLKSPDMLFMDIQGAEYLVLSSLSPATRAGLKVIYCEVSMGELYKGQHTLRDIRVLLEPEFEFKGFAPFTNELPEDGNALWVRKPE